MRESSCRRSQVACAQIKFQVAMFDGTMIAFADIAENKDAGRQK